MSAAGASGSGAGFETLARGFYLEALLIDGEDVWFTDVAKGGVRRAGSDQVLLKDRTMIGGLLQNEDGKLLVAGGGDIAWADPKTGAEGVLVGGFGGTNEMRSDGKGGMVFGTIDLPAILRGEKPGPSSICRLSADQTLTVAYEGLAFANGLSLSPDGETLYFNESFAAVRAFPVRADGSLGAPRLFLDKYDCDGMALDVEGNVWITGFASNELLCLASDGREIRRFALPGPSTNVRFGGPDLQDLYVTVVDPASAQALAEGRPLEEENSVLLRTRSPVPGSPLARTRFKLN